MVWLVPSLSITWVLASLHRECREDPVCIKRLAVKHRTRGRRCSEPRHRRTPSATAARVCSEHGAGYTASNQGCDSSDLARFQKSSALPHTVAAASAVVDLHASPLDRSTSGDQARSRDRAAPGARPGRRSFRRHFHPRSRSSLRRDGTACRISSLLPGPPGEEGVHPLGAEPVASTRQALVAARRYAGKRLPSL